MSVKKISRRDAMKLLGAAMGGAALSTLPSKWNTPELAAGVLPAHAQQSGACSGSLTRTHNGFTLAADGNWYYFPFNEGPITASDLDSCAIFQFTIAWAGANIVGTSVTFAFANSPVLNAVPLAISAGASPLSLYAPQIWATNRPYNGFIITKAADANNWVSGAISFTFSY